MQSQEKIVLVKHGDLRFGHDDGMNFNSRRTDADPNLARRADNLRTFGIIIPLVTTKAKGKTYVVDGNRRLAAVHLIAKNNVKDGFGKVDVDRIPTIDQADLDGTEGLELSLILNTEREPIHPVDKFEVFYALKEDGGMSVDQIAKRHGVAKVTVERALALAALSPKVREVWRDGKISTEAAQAFTLAPVPLQEKTLARLLKQGAWTMDNAYNVRNALGIGQNVAAKFVTFVGPESYEAAGGKITRDLFGNNHVIDKPDLAKGLADEKLKSVCGDLVAHGWKWAEPDFVVAAGAKWQWQQVDARPKHTPEQDKRIKQLQATIEATDENADNPDETACMDAYIELAKINMLAEEEAYKPAVRAKTGCIVSVGNDGTLEVKFGMVKPEDQPKASPGKGALPTTSSAAPDKKKAELSNALRVRLETQQTKATQAAITQSTTRDDLSAVLCKMTAKMLADHASNFFPHELKEALPAIRTAIDAKIMNAALSKAFDAEDYFAGAPKAFTVRAIREIDPNYGQADLMKKPRAAVAKLALDEMKTSKGKPWLPPELRTPNYDGPGAKKAPAKKGKK